MESQSIEYKKIWRDEYLKWICAFANTEGGKLYIGIDDAALDVSNETLIQNLHLTEGDCLTRACMLAFYPDPEKWVTGAYIKVAYFENDADILYQDEIHGPLILQVEKTMDLIYSKYMKALISYDDIIADKLGKNEKTIKRDIDELKKQNLLKHSDSRNNGYWIILSGAEK